MVYDRETPEEAAERARIKHERMAARWRARLPLMYVEARLEAALATDDGRLAVPGSDGPVPMAEADRLRLARFTAPRSIPGDPLNLVLAGPVGSTPSGTPSASRPAPARLSWPSPTRRRRPS